MLGIVLCGGNSSRMGADKGLLSLNDTTWAGLAINKLSKLGLTVFVSVNVLQHAIYKENIPSAAFIPDNTSLSVKGPLLGVLSAHLLYPQEDFLVLACDMPMMESFLLQELLAHHTGNSDKDAFVFATNGEPEPLCGIYTARALASILNLHRTGQARKFSMKYVLEQTETLIIPVAAANEKYFANINTHAALNGL